MADEKKIQLRDINGNKILPKTLGKIVINNAGENLGTVEANAQVNKLEKIKVNGTELTITDKTANVIVPAAAEYTLIKQETAEETYESTYCLTKDGVVVGTKINVAKDQFVKAGSVKTCTTANQPLDGLKVGDAYIDLEFQNDDKHLIIPANDLVDVYTAGSGIIIDDHEVKIDESVVSTKSFVEGLPSVQSGITSTKVEAYEAHVSNADIHVSSTERTAAIDSGITVGKVDVYDAHVTNGNIHVTQAQVTEWTNKQVALSSDQLAVVNSGLTAEKLTDLTGFASNKQDKLTDAQLAAVNSGITATDKSNYDSHIENEVKHITSTERATWNAKKSESEYTSEKEEVDGRVEQIEDDAEDLSSITVYYRTITIPEPSQPSENPTEPEEPTQENITVDSFNETTGGVNLKNTSVISDDNAGLVNVSGTVVSDTDGTVVLK